MDDDNIYSRTAPDPKAAKAQVAAAKAAAKAMRPWYKKKRFVIPLGFVAVMVIAGVAGGGSGDDEGSSNVSSSGAPSDAGSSEESADGGSLFPGRVDAQKEDKERNIGEGAELSGYTATVVGGGFQPTLNDFETDGYIVIDVSILNRDDQAQSYNYFDWKIQTPGGQVHDPDFSIADGQLESGDLVPGGTVTGKVVFEVGAERGDFYVIYKPDAFDAARGIWKITI